MPEGLQTPGGEPLDLEAAEQEFARAMSAPAGDVPAPKRMTAEQKEAVKTAPRRRAKPAGDAKPRTASPASQKSSKDFTDDLANLMTGLWLTAASIPFTTPYAAVIKANQPALVASLNSGAQNNAKFRARIEGLSSGGNGVWMVQLGVLGANMAMQTLTIMRDPEMRKQLAEQTRAEVREYLTRTTLTPEDITDGEPVAAG